ncbi:hypothetical protein Trydic_g675 [Trypoxylus dichotomus]
MATAETVLYAKATLNRTVGAPYSTIEWTTPASIALLQLLGLPMLGISRMRLPIFSDALAAALSGCSLKFPSVSK